MLLSNRQQYSNHYSLSLSLSLYICSMRPELFPLQNISKNHLLFFTSTSTTFPATIFHYGIILLTVAPAFIYSPLTTVDLPPATLRKPQLLPEGSLCNLQGCSSRGEAKPMTNLKMSQPRGAKEI